MPASARGFLSGVYVRLLSTAAGVVAADQVTKQLAIQHLDDGPVDLVPGVLSLKLSINSGGAFGIMQGRPVVFLLATLGVVLAILVFARKLTESSLAVPLGLVLGGGLGNVIDRLLRPHGGGVIDFLYLHHWPIFNVADSCIVVGVGLIALAVARSEAARQRQQGAHEARRAGPGD